MSDSESASLCVYHQHQTIINILKVTASWTKDRITSDSLMPDGAPHCLLTIDGGVAADRETLPGFRGRIGSSGSGGRESFLTVNSGQTARCSQSHTSTSGHTGRPARAECTTFGIMH